MAIALIIAYNRVLEDDEGKLERIDEMFEMYKRKPKAKKTTEKVVKEEPIKTKYKLTAGQEKNLNEQSKDTKEA